MKIKIDLESLFYMADEHFENTKAYHEVRLKCLEKQNKHLRNVVAPKEKTLYIDCLKGNDAHNFATARERSKCGERMIWDFCRILGINRERLYCIVRVIKKWYKKRNWEGSFPFTDKEKSIIRYLQT